MEPIGGEDPEAIYEYMCNIHIIRAVKLVAIIGLVLNPLWGLYMLFSSPVIPYDFSLVFLCLYALILVAIHKENPRLLIPFLIFNGILIAGRILYCLVVLFTINSQWFWSEWSKQHPGADTNVEKVGLIIHLIVNILKVGLNVWFEHVIYRGYLFMLGRAEATPLLVTTTASPVRNAPSPPSAPPFVAVPHQNAPPPPPAYGHHEQYYQPI